ncbi:sialate O-acetylesterase [Echinicola sediminis]
MVLQRDAPLPIWGNATPDTRIKVDINGQSVSTVAGQDSTWYLEFPAQKKGGPFQLTVQGDSTLVLQDVYFGDIWVCSGQSNMEWPVERVKEATEEINQANFDRIRLFEVPHQMTGQPVVRLPDSVGWRRCSPRSIKDFSAVGYFFGRELHQELDVPIGLISTNWGGTNIEAWTSKETLSRFPVFKDSLEQLGALDLDKMKEDADHAIAVWQHSMDSLDLGLQHNWSDPTVRWENPSKVQLPITLEHLDLPNSDGVFWFKKTVYLSEIADSDNALIHLGRIDEEDVTYLNGKMVGWTNGSQDKRAYPITPGVLRKGANTIVVRVKDKGWTGGFKGIPEHLKLEIGSRIIALSGEWEMKVGIPDLPVSPKNIHPNNFPSTLFNGMIHPLIPFSIKGVIWYQGESNASRAFVYREMFPAMIQDWRNHWGQGDFPFYFVQLANYRAVEEQPGESTWAELRESQSKALQLPNTGMAVAIDLGEADDIHPKNKQEVGRRLALSALENTYRTNLLSAGPLLDHHEVIGDKMRLYFVHTGEGIHCNDGQKNLNGFTLAGADHQFYRAKAVVESDSTVLVSHGSIEQPQAVRYGWADNPGPLNFYNSEQLPASPFRTDDWKVSTE